MTYFSGLMGRSLVQVSLGPTERGPIACDATHYNNRGGSGSQRCRCAEQQRIKKHRENNDIDSLHSCDPSFASRRFETPSPVDHKNRLWIVHVDSINFVNGASEVTRFN